MELFSRRKTKKFSTLFYIHLKINAYRKRVKEKVFQKRKPDRKTPVLQPGEDILVCEQAKTPAHPQTYTSEFDYILVLVYQQAVLMHQSTLASLFRPEFEHHDRHIALSIDLLAEVDKRRIESLLMVRM